MKKKKIIKVLKKVFSVRMIISLIIILSVNSYAWFIFATKVETGITARVRAWNVLFEFHENPLTEHLEFNVNEIYPGMTTYTDHATVSNDGDGDATLSFKIDSVRILETTYIVDEVNYTSNGVIQMLLNDFPFVVSLYVTNSTVTAGGGEESFVITVSWPYESGNDVLDTTWGSNAYEYNTAHPDDSSIAINITLEVMQAEEIGDGE